MKAARPARLPRAYDNSLRAEQAEKTRERILEALAGTLSRGEDDFDLSALAREAGVSLRTVYHHFPNRDALLEALAAWVDARALASEAGPKDAADLPAYARRLFRQALENEAMTRATLAPGVADRIRGLRRKQRLAAIAKAVQEIGAPPRDSRLVAALLQHLLSGDTGMALLDRYGVPREEAAGLAAWATDALVQALRRGPGPAGFAADGALPGA
jgi:AcrR family transcriptional regulator